MDTPAKTSNVIVIWSKPLKNDIFYKCFFGERIFDDGGETHIILLLKTVHLLCNSCLIQKEILNISLKLCVWDAISNNWCHIIFSSFLDFEVCTCYSTYNWASIRILHWIVLTEFFFFSFFLFSVHRSKPMRKKGFRKKKKKSLEISLSRIFLLAMKNERWLQSI